jgi:O-acetyl-ADP-ribose deacetylase (regulator of RNase III)
MLRFVSTSILESRAQTVVNTVNTVGVMGKGLAAEFRKKAPAMFSKYQEFCNSKQLSIGKLWLWKNSDPWILNFPTKEHWRNPSKISYIEAGLKKFVEKYEEQGITEISFPRLGCGNGGLDWDNVRPLMEQYLGKLPIQVYIHDFQVETGAPEHQAVSSATYKKSFSQFIEDIKTLAAQSSHQFKTISAQTEFQIGIDSEAIVVKRPNSVSTKITLDDVYEAWSMLLQGPLTPHQLIGSAHTNSSYLLGIIATLPYVRAIQLRTDSENTPRQAVELIGQFAEHERFELGHAATAQEEMWH